MFMIIKSNQNMRFTYSPSASVSVHVTVDMQGLGGTSWVDGVHPTGAGVVMAVDVITVNGQVKLGVRVPGGHKKQQS